MTVSIVRMTAHSFLFSASLWVMAKILVRSPRLIRSRRSPVPATTPSRNCASRRSVSTRSGHRANGPLIPGFGSPFSRLREFTGSVYSPADLTRSSRAAEFNPTAAQASAADPEGLSVTTGNSRTDSP